jgi:hypothetical protein
MLRACPLQDKSGWDKRLPYVEFSYNNSYQASLKMSRYKYSMGGIIELCCTGTKPAKGRCSVRIFCLRPKRISVWFGRI